MTLQERLKQDLKTAIKEKDNPRRDAIRVIMGDIARNRKKELDDKEIISIIKKLANAEREVFETQGKDKFESLFWQICQCYIPILKSEEEIVGWIFENIDFSKIKNKMQAMKPIMEHFGTSVDGNIVKDILLNKI